MTAAGDIVVVGCTFIDQASSSTTAEALFFEMLRQAGVETVP